MGWLRLGVDFTQDQRCWRWRSAKYAEFHVHCSGKCTQLASPGTKCDACTTIGVLNDGRTSPALGFTSLRSTCYPVACRVRRPVAGSVYAEAGRPASIAHWAVQSPLATEQRLPSHCSGSPAAQNLVHSHAIRILPAASIAFIAAVPAEAAGEERMSSSAEAAPGASALTTVVMSAAKSA